MKLLDSQPDSVEKPAGIKVLYVEDHEETREAISLLLAQDGYQVGTAASFAEAVAQAEQEEYDVYLLDIRLPDGNGIDLCHTLRWLTPTVPSIYYTAQDDMAEEARRRCQQPLLIKPVKIDELERVIEETVGGRASS